MTTTAPATHHRHTLLQILFATLLLSVLLTLLAPTAQALPVAKVRPGVGRTSTTATYTSPTLTTTTLLTRYP
jgi:hypothetical protein